jgi:bifunctional DNA-binding transcriptional regulator/antitoxin component of YhaV-PrlF toxin-antitoxin module
MRPMRFHAVIQLNNKTATGIAVPPDVLESLGAGKRPAVRVTINGHTYRTTVGSVDGQAMLPVSAEVRQGAGVAAGDEVEVEIELDTAPREVTVPPDFAAALDQDPAARRFFDGLSYSNKRRFTLPIEEAKRAETRERRIAKAVSQLREGRL